MDFLLDIHPLRSSLLLCFSYKCSIILSYFLLSFFLDKRENGIEACIGMVRWGVDAIRLQALHAFDAPYSWHLQCWWCPFILDPLSSPLWYAPSSSCGFIIQFVSLVNIKVKGKLLISVVFCIHVEVIITAFTSMYYW